jgi:hypothetical protein
MRPRSAGVALATPFVLLVTACGSHQPGVFHPEGAIVTAPSPSAATGSGPVPFPGKLRFEFDPLPSDPAQAKLVAADRDFILAYYYAVYTRGKSDRYASYIGDKNVLLTVRGNVAQQVAGHRGYAGMTRYFDTRVAAVPGYHGDEDVTYCVDESQLRHTDIRTGQVVPKGYPANQQYYAESDMFAKGQGGAWRLVGTLVSYYPNGQARECKP